MTFLRIGNAQRNTFRTFSLLAMLSLTALNVFGAWSPAAAQGNWWDWPQTGAPSYGEKRSEADRTERKPVVLEDLRPGQTPWCSDVMFNAIGGAIERYEKIVANGGWPQIPKGRMMRPGDEDERVPVLRKMLRITGDMPAKGQYYASQTYDSEVEEGVKRFQIRHGLKPSGTIVQSMYPVLNITAEQRLSQLKLNFERLRALGSCGNEERYVFVNVPAFQLEAVEQREVEQRHRIIVGRNERQTPDVHTVIKALNFFPYWRVPDSIAMLDLVPLAQKTPEYLVNEGIRVFNGYNGPELDRSTIDWTSPQVTNYKFKQDPGDKNALGLVRLDMSNEHGVYMHDTPMKKLFDQRSRPFSAGCVRVQEVFQLAEWIARYEPGWDKPGQVRAVLESGQALDLNLTRPVPVYFAYLTAWAEPQSGSVEFRADIYGRDGADSRDTLVHDENDVPPAAAANALAP
ncbi:MAG: L,D-transpeptidase family protein [Hyphomicrobium sp.]